MGGGVPANDADGLLKTRESETAATGIYAGENAVDGGLMPRLPESSINSSISIKAMMKGSWEGDIYRNQYAGFTLTLIPPWERRAEKDGYVTGKEDVVGALAVNPDNGDNVLVRFFSMVATTGAQGVYEEDFLLGMKKNVEKNVASQAEFGAVFDVSVGDMSYKCMKESIGGDITMYYLARRISDYMNIISIKTEGELSDVISMFG
jgi:hypothetical protein